MTKRRSHDRAVAVIYRVSPENRELLKQRASREGFASMQEWLDHKLLNQQRPEQELPMTG